MIMMTVRGVIVMIPPLDPDLESDFQVSGDSGSTFGFSKKPNCNTY